MSDQQIAMILLAVCALWWCFGESGDDE